MKPAVQTLAFIVAALLSAPALTADVAAPARRPNPALNAYLKVSDALFKDDLPGAKSAAAGLVEAVPPSTLAKPAKAVAEAKDIAAARDAFKDLSAAAVTIAEAGQPSALTVMQCPMVREGKGLWLSPDGKVNNPYFGAKMAHCGGPRQKGGSAPAGTPLPPRKLDAAPPRSSADLDTPILQRPHR